MRPAGRIPGQVAQRQHGVIDHRGVKIQPIAHGGPIPRRVKPGAVGHRAAPLLLRPAEAPKPVVRPERLHPLLDGRFKRLARLHLRQVDLSQRIAAFEQVHVGVDQAGTHRRAVRVDDVAHRGSLIIQRGDAAVFDRQTAGCRTMLIAGPDACVVQVHALIHRHSIVHLQRA